MVRAAPDPLGRPAVGAAEAVAGADEDLRGAGRLVAPPRGGGRRGRAGRGGVTSASPAPASPLPVLMYHAIGTPMPASLSDLSVPPALLAEQLAALAADGYRMVGLTEALALGGDRSDRTVALTFDDAYVDFASEAVPALAAVGATATLYAPSRHVGGTAAWLPAPADALPLLDAGALRERGRRGARGRQPRRRARAVRRPARPGGGGAARREPRPASRTPPAARCARSATRTATPPGASPAGSRPRGTTMPA